MEVTEDPPLDIENSELAMDDTESVLILVLVILRLSVSKSAK